MKTYLLSITLDQDKCLEKSEKVVDGLTETGSMTPGLADSDLFIYNIDELRGHHLLVLELQKHHLTQKIKRGGVLLCFAGIPVKEGSYSNYTILENLGADLWPEKLLADEINFLGNQPFIKKLQKVSKEFCHTVIFNKRPSGSFVPIAANKSGNFVASYGEVGAGHVFILPQPKNVNAFVKYFIDEILPMLNLNFTIEDGSKEPMPEEIKDLVVSGQNELKKKISEQNEIIKKESGKLENLNEEYLTLESWKDLLYQTGTPLENKVQDFFKTFFDIDLEKEDIDLVGEYKGKPLFIEVKGNKGCIDHKNDFRQSLQRKTIDADDPGNTIVLLVGSPYRLNPLESRPPEGESLFSPHSIPIAEKIGIGLVSTAELYKIVNEIIGGSNVDKNKIIDDIMNCSGVYSYK